MIDDKELKAFQAWLLNVLWQEMNRYRGVFSSQLKKNPINFWEILRSSKSYQKSVKEFWSDKTDGDFVKLLNFIDAEKSPMAFPQLIGLGKDKKMELHSHHFAFAISELLGGASSTHGFKNPFSFDVKDKAYQRFLQKWGDVLIFPIPFEIEEPEPIFFNAVWTYRPLAYLNADIRREFESSDFYGHGKFSNNLVLFDVCTNLNFANIEIERSVGDLIGVYEESRDVKAGSKGLMKEKQKPHWDKLSECAFIFSERSKSTEVSWEKVVRAFEAEFGAIKQADKKSFVRNRYAYAAKSLIPLFTR